MNGVNIRRVLLADINYDHPQKGMLHAFQGIFGRENVSEYDYLERQRRLKDTDKVNAEFKRQAIEFRPDWIWLQLQNTDVITAKTLWEIRGALPECVVSHWMGDARPDVKSYLASICKATHITFLASIGHIPLYEKAGAPEVQYLQIGLDWEEDILQVPEWKPPFEVPPVVFIGNFYGGLFPGTPDRVQAVESLLSAGIPLGIVGSGWDRSKYPVLGACGVKQQVHVWKRAQVGISVNHFNDAAGYYSDRHLIALASGTPLVCQRIEDLERDFDDGKELFMFTTPEMLVSQVKQLLGDAELRRKMGTAGRRRVLMHHTWFVRICDALARVSELREGMTSGVPAAAPLVEERKRRVPPPVMSRPQPQVRRVIRRGMILRRH